MAGGAVGWSPRWLLSLTAGVTFVVAALGGLALLPNLGAEFGPIDDHEPLRWMGADGVLTPAEIGSTLLGATELGDFGSASRYRPSYYLVRVLQSVLLGPNPMSWYLWVIGSYVVACAVLGIVVAHWMAFALREGEIRRGFFVILVLLAGGLATLAFAGLPAWRGIAARLGPSELLGAVALALLLLSVTLVMNGRAAGWWVLVIAATWLAVGAKETMLPLVLIPFITAVNRMSVGGSRRKLTFAAILGLFPALIVVVAVLLLVLSGETSGYGSTEGGSRTALALTGLLSTYRLYWLPSAIVFILALVALFLARVAPRRVVWTLVAFALVSWLWFAFDMWVYSGTYPLPRYEFNTQVIKILWITGALSIGVAVIVRSRRGRDRMAGVCVVFLAGILAASTLIAAPANLSALRMEAKSNAQATQQYRVQMDDALEAISESIRPSILIVQSGQFDAEAAVAITQEIQFRNEVDPLLVTVLAQPLADKELESVPTQQVCIFINQDSVQDGPCAGASVFRVDARGM